MDVLTFTRLIFYEKREPYIWIKRATALSAHETQNNGKKRERFLEFLKQKRL